MIKPLERIFFLVGADPTDWFREMPKVQRILRSSAQPGTAKVMLDEHFVSDRCAVCGGSEGNGGAWLVLEATFRDFGIPGADTCVLSQVFALRARRTRARWPTRS